jgi:hypothetical protein
VVSGCCSVIPLPSLLFPAVWPHSLLFSLHHQLHRPTLRSRNLPHHHHHTAIPSPAHPPPTPSRCSREPLPRCGFLACPSPDSGSWKRLGKGRERPPPQPALSPPRVDIGGCPSPAPSRPSPFSLRSFIVASTMAARHPGSPAAMQLHHGPPGGPPPPGMAPPQQWSASQQLVAMNEAVWLQIGRQSCVGHGQKWY